MVIGGQNSDLKHVVAAPDTAISADHPEVKKWMAVRTKLTDMPNGSTQQFSQAAPVTEIEVVISNVADGLRHATGEVFASSFQKALVGIVEFCESTVPAKKAALHSCSWDPTKARSQIDARCKTSQGRLDFCTKFIPDVDTIGFLSLAITPPPAGSSTR